MMASELNSVPYNNPSISVLEKNIVYIKQKNIFILFFMVIYKSILFG